MDEQQIDELRAQMFAKHDTTGEKLQAILNEWAERYHGCTKILTLEQSLMIRAEIIEALIQSNIKAAAAKKAEDEAGNEASAAAGNHTSN